tara:strand:+ start:882 stop:1655 length:774 start_codon:yes stop_codon:yes gene_type:complete
MKEEDILSQEIKFLDDDVYYADRKYLTNSMLGKLGKSPQHLREYFEGVGESSPALTFGKAFHTTILEPGKVDSDIAIFDGKTRRGKVWDEFVLDNEGKTIISVSEWNAINQMSDIIYSNDVAATFLMKSHKESVRIWETGGVKCKGKADMVIIDDNGDKILIDIKTTQDCSLDAFRRSSMKYGYDRQAAWYLDGFGATDFWFVVIEKASPYRLAIYQASDEFIGAGRLKNNALLNKYKEFFIDKSSSIDDYYFKGLL